MKGRSAEILLVEDSAGDRRLIVEAFKKAESNTNVSVVKDGIEALNFLRRGDGYADAPRPDLVLLDLNLPKKDGREVLQEIKTDDALNHIPVLILTTSQADQDVLHSYQLHANCFITKPVALRQFMRVIEAVQLFWLDIATLPTTD
jgi:two-component system, chemotaxis family, response regulator Rcp1